MNIERYCEHEKGCSQRYEGERPCSCGLDDELEQLTWKPFESAPKDGTRILAWAPTDKSTALILWNMSEGCWIHGYTGYPLYPQPTHWMLPLPGPFIAEKTLEDVALEKICSCSSCQSVGRTVIAALKEQK